MGFFLKGTLIRSGQEDLDKAFLLACIDGNFDKIDYMLNSKDLNLRPDIYAEDCFGFKSACSNNHTYLIKYLIFEIGIEKTQSIDIFLTTSPNSFKKNVFNWFKLRELNNKLGNELNSDKIIKKTIKV